MRHPCLCNRRGKGWTVKTALLAVAGGCTLSMLAFPAHAADHGPLFYKSQKAVVSVAGVESAVSESTDASGGSRLESRVVVSLDRQPAWVTPPQPYDLWYPIRRRTAEALLNVEVSTVKTRWGGACDGVVERTYGKGQLRAYVEVEPPAMRTTRTLPATRVLRMGANRTIALYVQPVEPLTATVSTVTTALNGQGQCETSSEKQPLAPATDVDGYSGNFVWMGRIKPRSQSAQLQFTATAGATASGEGTLTLRRPLTLRW